MFDSAFSRDAFSRDPKGSAGEDALPFGSRLNGRRGRVIEVIVVLTAVVIAAVSARDFAWGANDKSRLATVECLVDYHTFAIDRSTWFAETCDMIRPHPDGPFFSDKPPVMALLLAVPYQVMQSVFGIRAADHKEVFCYLLTLFSSGLAYVVAVWCVFRLGRVVGLSPGWAAALTASFALATIAPVYARHVNSSLPTLAAALAVVLNLAAIRKRTDSADSFSLPHKGGGGKSGRLLLIGALCGFAYALEQPTGGLLLAAAVVTAAVRLRPPSVIVWIVLAALPWGILHHAVVYGYTGMIGPAGANPAFWDYPGSQFDAHDLTGRWNHAGLGDFIAYAFLLLFGSRGFLLSNPTLLLAVPAAGWALWRLPAARVETVCFGLWCLGVWLLYAALSTNYGGACCSIRWFVPLLAPAVYWLALMLRDLPQFRMDFIVFSGWGAVLAAYFWVYGPFGAFDYQPSFPYFFWSVQAAGCFIWLIYRAAVPISAAPRL
ncbi:MAG TPA: hypothetical protein DDY78_24000 [Planctomycetales bacterium]|nr:hypothetical protein [Planctomycetales bacterium]